MHVTKWAWGCVKIIAIDYAGGMNVKTKLPLPALRVLGWLAFAALLAATALTLWLPTGEIPSDSSRFSYSLFTPAPFTRYIWIVICAGQLLFLLHQSGLWRRGAHDALTERVGLLPTLANALGGAGLLLWACQRSLAALAVLAAALLTLAAVHRRVGEPEDRRDRWLTQVPFRLYLGWASVSAMACAAAVLAQGGFPVLGLPEDIWAALLVAFAAVLGVAMLLRHRDFPFAAAMAWALLGIFIRHTMALDGIYSSVALTSLLGLMAVAGGIAYAFFQGKR